MKLICEFSLPHCVKLLSLSAQMASLPYISLQCVTNLLSFTVCFGDLFKTSWQALQLQSTYARCLPMRALFSSTLALNFSAFHLLLNFLLIKLPFSMNSHLYTYTHIAIVNRVVIKHVLY